MSLTIEDGSIVADAESYASVAELVTFAAQYGKTLPSSSADKEALLRRAALAMDAMNWKGCRVSADQVLSWPRYDVCRNGFIEASDAIPANIKKGQMALACEIYEDDQAPPEAKQGPVKRKKVEGAIEVEYADIKTAFLQRAAGRQSTAFLMGFLSGGGATTLVRA